jgi:hypothetical protein
MDRFNLSVEELEERIAPDIAPGLNGPGADVPPGESGPNHSPVATDLWFGKASGQF